MKILSKIVAEATKPKGEVIPILMKNIGGHYPERSHKTVHASDITKVDFCPRQYALMDKHEVKQPDRYLAPGLKATFDMGNATSDLVRESWLGDRSIGHWDCMRCGAQSLMTPKPQSGCGGAPCIWKYRELNFVDPVVQVSGSIDVLVNLNAPKLFVTEVKIIKSEDFDKLAAPMAEHRIRTSLYMKLVEASDNPYRHQIHYQRAKVLYVSRGFGKKHEEHGGILPFKEFDVVRDDQAIAPYLAKPKALAAFRNGDGPMPLGVCPTPACPRAKSCPVMTHCWATA